MLGLLQTLLSIEKAIRESPLHLNPRIDGEEILVPVPRSGPCVRPLCCFEPSLFCGLGWFILFLASPTPSGGGEEGASVKPSCEVTADQSFCSLGRAVCVGDVHRYPDWCKLPSQRAGCRSQTAAHDIHNQCRPNADTIKAMAKMIKQEGEASRVAVRSARRNALEQVKKMSSMDDKRKTEKQVMPVIRTAREGYTEPVLADWKACNNATVNRKPVPERRGC
jgi:hypothetical protein